MRKLATLTVVAAMACAPSLRVQHPRAAPDRVVGAELLGARGTDAIVFLEHLSPRGFVVRSLALDDGTSQILARTEDPRDTAWLSSVHDRFGWRALPATGHAVRPDAVFAIDDTLLLHVDEPSGLAGYATASVEAVYGKSRVTLTELVQVRGLRVGPLYRTGHHGVLVVRDGDTESLRILDLDAARTALDNLEAMRHLKAGDLDRAGDLLEDAVARTPASGESVYNLACVRALQGRLDEAEDTLAIALAIDGKRYARLARGDGDLAPLRERDAVREKIGLKPRKGL